MKVVLSVPGKFHLFDLARQLHQRGVLSKVFSSYPWIKLKGESLPREQIHTFPWIHAPFQIMNRIPTLPAAWLREIEWLDKICFDRYVAKEIRDCECLVALSGSGYFSGKAVKSDGGKYICDRGSSHILVQDQILRDEYALAEIPFSGIDGRILEREQAEYELADVITVPSMFALNSFLRMGIREEKLRLIPYGVDLKRFSKTGTPPPKEFRVLYVGALSVRKGIRYLLDAFEKITHPQKSLHLVGPQTRDYRYSNEEFQKRGITVHRKISQELLKHVMSTSHVLVLPSVEDGFGLVLAQAMACGCPLIGTSHTGIGELVSEGIEGFVVEPGNVEELAQKLQLLIDSPLLREEMSRAAIEKVARIKGWGEYGIEFSRVVAQVTKDPAFE